MLRWPKPRKPPCSCYLSVESPSPYNQRISTSCSCSSSRGSVVNHFDRWIHLLVNNMHIINNIFSIINSMTKLHTLVIIENIVLIEIKGIRLVDSPSYE
jgi:hypothetical protein